MRPPISEPKWGQGSLRKGRGPGPQHREGRDFRKVLSLLIVPCGGQQHSPADH